MGRFCAIFLIFSLIGLFSGSITFRVGCQIGLHSSLGVTGYHQGPRMNTKPYGEGLYHEGARMNTKPCGMLEISREGPLRAAKPCGGGFYHEGARRCTKPCGRGLYHEEARMNTKPCGMLDFPRRAAKGREALRRRILPRRSTKMHEALRRRILPRRCTKPCGDECNDYQCNAWGILGYPHVTLQCLFSMPSGQRCAASGLLEGPFGIRKKQQRLNKD